jgi:succinate-semialdehyde dehydrogenase / glutarate-semialdehyde dehydrogenase
MATTAGPYFATVSPVSGEVLKEFEPLDGAALDGAVDAAHAAFERWRLVPIPERARMVGRAGEIMAERADRLAQLVTLEMGKLIGESRREVDISAEILRWYGRRGPEIAADEPLASEAGDAVVVSEPLGVLLAVEPWNYPLYQVARVAGPNLTLGNTILLKHARICPQTALALEELFHDAGVPEGAYANIFAQSANLPRVIESPAVRGVALTGSDRAGANVAERAAWCSSTARAVASRAAVRRHQALGLRARAV